MTMSKDMKSLIVAIASVVVLATSVGLTYHSCGTESRNYYELWNKAGLNANRLTFDQFKFMLSNLTSAQCEKFYGDVRKANGMVVMDKEEGDVDDHTRHVYTAWTKAGLNAGNLKMIEFHAIYNSLYHNQRDELRRKILQLTPEANVK